MKVTEVLRALDEFERLYADHGRAAEAAALHALAAFLQEHERKSISALVAAIRASRSKMASSTDFAASGRNLVTMNLRQLHDLLARIARIVDRSGGKRQAGDLLALAEALAEEPVSSFEDAIIQIRTRLAHRPSGGRRQSRPTVSVDAYVCRLERAREATEIYTILQEFRDRSFKKTELDKIAHRFAKGPSKYKSKADAIDDIEERFFQRNRSTREIEFLERKKVTPW